MTDTFCQRFDELRELHRAELRTRRIFLGFGLLMLAAFMLGGVLGGFLDHTFHQTQHRPVEPITVPSPVEFANR